MGEAPSHEALLRILDRARTLGLTGPGSAEVHLRQAAAMATVVSEPPATFLDLGSGAGVPGLALLTAWPDATGVLLDAGSRRCGFLRSAIAELGLTDRAAVAEGRAEQLAHDPELRSTFDLVVARGFGPPAVTAECAAGFLRVAGVLVVTEPPEPDAQRWDHEALGTLGFVHQGITRRGGFGFSLLRLDRIPAPDWPRRSPQKRPLWGRST